MRLFRRCNQCRSDAGAEKLEGDFLTVAEFDSIAIGAVFEPREDDLFLVLDAEVVQSPGEARPMLPEGKRVVTYFSDSRAGREAYISSE